MKRKDRLNQLTLIQLWNTIFLGLNGEDFSVKPRYKNLFVTGNLSDIRKDKYRIIKAGNKVDQWRCMVEPGIFNIHPRPIEKGGIYSKDFKSFASHILHGRISVGNDEKSKKSLSSANRTNYRYEELLEYLIKCGPEAINKEIAFISSTITNSLCLRLYFQESAKQYDVRGEESVPLKDLEKYRETLSLDLVKELTRTNLQDYFSEIDNVDVFFLLAIAIMYALAEIDIDGESDKKLSNGENILKLQKCFVQILEEYLNDESSDISQTIDVDLCANWTNTFSIVRDTITEDFGYPVTGKLISALDKRGEFRLKDIDLVLFGIMSRREIDISLKQLQDDINGFKNLLEALERLRDYRKRI